MEDIDIRRAIEKALDDAENTWNEVKDLFESYDSTKVFNRALEVPTKIPGVPTLQLGKPEVRDYVSLVLDIRGSTNHLTQAIAKPAKVNLLERTLYETTAVITGGILCMEEHGGGVTELLGDGLLALFKAEKREDVYAAHNAAKKTIRINSSIVNDILKSRYSLPPLQIGIGLAYSKALVTILGTENNYHPKAIGDCVYRASKIAKGYNEIYIDEKLRLFWPTSDKGKLRFTFVHKKHNFEAYKIEKD